MKKETFKQGDGCEYNFGTMQTSTSLDKLSEAIRELTEVVNKLTNELPKKQGALEVGGEPVAYTDFEWAKKVFNQE
jgi:hypothetical protein